MPLSLDPPLDRRIEVIQILMQRIYANDSLIIKKHDSGNTNSQISSSQYYHESNKMAGTDTLHIIEGDGKRTHMIPVPYDSC